MKTLKVFDVQIYIYHSADFRSFPVQVSITGACAAFMRSSWR